MSGLGLNAAEIGRRLGVNRSSVTRWMAAGKLHRAERPAPTPTVTGGAPASQSPAEWAAAVRAEFQLSPTDEQLVALGESALLLSRDMKASPQVRMSAMSRFQALVKQLPLVPRKGAEEQPVVPPAAAMVQERVSRRPTVDPRTRLMAVK